MRYALLLAILTGCAAPLAPTVTSPTPPKAHTRMVASTPPLPPGADLPAPHAAPRQKGAQPAIPDPADAPRMERERLLAAARYDAKAAAMSTGILYAYEVQAVDGAFRHRFDVPDEWTGWLVQRRAPSADHWEECGRSVSKPTRGQTLISTNGCQFRLVRTADVAAP